MKVKKPFNEVTFYEVFPSLGKEIQENLLRSRAMRFLYEGLGNLATSVKIEEALHQRYSEDPDSYIECILQISTCTGNDIISLLK